MNFIHIDVWKTLIFDQKEPVRKYSVAAGLAHDILLPKTKMVTPNYVTKGTIQALQSAGVLGGMQVLCLQHHCMSAAPHPCSSAEPLTTMLHLRRPPAREGVGVGGGSLGIR